MTVNVVFPQADDGHGCADVARRWLDAAAGTPDALRDGPLRDLPPVGSIEVNLQAVRWPSNERREMGGHAEYILRVFRATADGLVAAPLENTPRVDLGADAREELRRWIAEHLSEIDDGTAVVPAKFLATRAISVAPRGLARTANRAYAQLYPDPEAAFGDLPLAGTRQLKSVGALMRRLDTMTCHGCHQARAIAGFHLLGEERDNGARLNALAIGRSPHLNDELAWRAAFLGATAAGERPAAPRPFAERASGEPGKYGAHCGLGDPGFATWTCGAGLACTDLHGDAVGVCSPAAAPVGDACEAGRVTSNADPRRDHFVDHRELACDAGRGARCNPVELGFPDGMCRVDCAASELGTIAGETICGLVPSATGLTSCLAAHRPFAECLATQNGLTFLRTCDATESCRDDYACARVKDGPPGVGACMPPYFAFQARVDGHLFDE